MAAADAVSMMKKEGDAKVTEVEQQVCQALVDLRGSYTQLKSLHVVSAREVEVAGGVRAVVVFVPYREHSTYKKFQSRLVEDLEKKFSGKHFVFIAARRILRAPTVNNHKKMQKRPYSRTLTAVHEAMLADMVYPSRVIGRRTRVRLNGSKFLKIKLDSKDHKAEAKCATHAAVYKALSGAEATFAVGL